MMQMQAEALEQAKLLVRAGRNDYAKYAGDPAAFGQDVLGETFTDDIVEVMESVRDNPVTVAKSVTPRPTTCCERPKGTVSVA